jgi:AcrR family transcriptional regulator
MAESTPPGRTFRGQSQEERIAQRRRQLLAAGLSQFGARGFHAVSVRDVCGEAKLTERYFYESFKNREALFLAVYTEGVERVRAQVVGAMAQAGSELPLITRAGFHAYFDTLRSEPLLARVLLIDVLTIGVEAGSQSLSSTSSFVEMVTGTIADLYPDLRRHKLDPQWIGNGLVGATVFMAMQWAVSDFKEPVDHIVDNCCAFVDGLASLVRDQNAPAKATKRAASPSRSSRVRSAS